MNKDDKRTYGKREREKSEKQSKENSKERVRTKGKVEK